MTKVLVAGDIGQPVYHVGDEAMTVASATFFAGRGARIVLATRDEEHSRQLSLSLMQSTACRKKKEEPSCSTTSLI